MTKGVAITVLKAAIANNVIEDVNSAYTYIMALDMAIKALDQEPCTDSISRQAVLEIIRDFEYKNSHEEMLINSRIKQLPSIMPAEKVGRWKPYDGSWYECSECGAIREAVGYFENFCPNCGAKMQEVDE